MYLMKSIRLKASPSSLSSVLNILNTRIVGINDVPAYNYIDFS